MLLLLVCGCHQETPIERGTRLFRARQKSRFAAAAMQMKLFSGLSDGRMVRANPHDGLGLAIRVDKTEMRVGEPLRLHLVYENLSARGEISATTCQGFSLAAEEEATGVVAAVDLRFACPLDDPLRDNPAVLRRGNPRAVDVSTADTRLRFDRPGRYLILAGWQSFRPTEGMFGSRSEYAAVASNQVLIEVR